jgi:3-hydroxyacyl-[acyl-carrier-protein] dehydratase
MKLKDNFFIIQSAEIDAHKIIAYLQLMQAHTIYQGHFPGQPVVPGVCMLQMIKEIIEMQTGNNIQLINAADIKFLQVINPLENPLLKASIEYAIAEKIINITAALLKNEITCFKMKASYSIK